MAVLRAVGAALLAAAEHVPVGAAFVLDADLRFVDAGGPALRRFGWNPADMRGRRVVETVPSWYYAQVADHYEQALAGTPTRARTRSIDGSSVFDSEFLPVQPEADVIGVTVLSRALPASAGVRERLSARERELLLRAARGETSARIAEALFLSPTTVETHFRNAAAKLGARNRTHAVALALHLGEIDLSER